MSESERGPEGLGARYEARTALLEDAKQALESETREALRGLGHIDRISFRVKSTESFVEKALDRKTTPPYENHWSTSKINWAGASLRFFATI